MKPKFAIGDKVWMVLNRTMFKSCPTCGHRTEDTPEKYVWGAIVTHVHISADKVRYDCGNVGDRKEDSLYRYESLAYAAVRNSKLTKEYE